MISTHEPTAEEGGVSVYDVTLPIPFLSQRRDVAPENEPSRACGMTCVAMVLAGFGVSADLNTLVAEGKINGGLMQGKGWVHEYLAETFRRHGIACTRFDGGHTQHVPQDMSLVFAERIENGNPVLVSLTYKNGGHIVLLTGTRRDKEGLLKGFFLHDPDVDEVIQGMHQFMPIDIFMTRWRKLAIMPEKPVA